ncbi:MAG: protein translocase subunit SecD, partial [Rhodospirillales bacterium]|nr:protein translocase subunit SecD [Rhodospirillales bacterium]
MLAILVFGLLFAAPNIVDEKIADSLPTWLPNKQINLGLDLRGGSHLLLEVDVKSVVRERLVAVVEAVRSSLRRERIRYTGLGVLGEGVAVTIREPDKLIKAQELLGAAEVGLKVTAEGNKFTLKFSDENLRELKSSAVAQSIEIVRRRIDETGTKEPTIQRQGEDRILLQLPGVDDPERVKRLLGRTAKMTFHLLDSNGSIEEARRGRVPP